MHAPILYPRFYGPIAANVSGGILLDSGLAHVEFRLGRMIWPIVNSWTH